MLMDNGAPWGSDHDHPFTAFSLWLIRLGIRVAHGRAYHPQTQGKDERFHRTLKFEVLRHFNFTTLAHCQREFEHFRERYNLVRPHDALGLATPASRYRPSPIPFPELLAAGRVSARPRGAQGSRERLVYLSRTRLSAHQGFARIPHRSAPGRGQRLAP